MKKCIRIVHCKQCKKVFNHTLVHFKYMNKWITTKVKLSIVNNTKKCLVIFNTLQVKLSTVNDTKSVFPIYYLGKHTHD